LWGLSLSIWRKNCFRFNISMRSQSAFKGLIIIIIITLQKYLGECQHRYGR
jgi:ribose/xylose/arabinose/galactoside ABC-type transport system permease subunit